MDLVFFSLHFFFFFFSFSLSLFERGGRVPVLLRPCDSGLGSRSIDLKEENNFFFGGDARKIGLDEVFLFLCDNL